LVERILCFPIFQKQGVKPFDTPAFPAIILQARSQKLFKRLTSSPLNPEEVANPVAELIELPSGNRPLRITVGFPVNSFGGFNYFSAQLPSLDRLGRRAHGKLQASRCKMHCF
jgi:hypothetical protein